MSGRAGWAGRHVLVTGGSSGIGRELVHQLRGAGAVVSVLALDDTDLARLRASAPDVHVRGVDVTDAAAVGSATDELAAAAGPVRSLFTCAGISRPGCVQDLGLGDFRAQMEVNYFGTLHAVRAVLPGMLHSGDATITCISSAAGLLGVFGYAAYGPSKFAVRGLCEVLRQELKPHGVSVTAAYPPDVDTPQLAMETPLQPPELQAISGTIKPLTAQSVATAILRGTESGRSCVFPDVRTRALSRLVGTAPWFVDRALDRTIAKVRRRRPADPRRCPGPANLS
ncbi:SDR family NAD(P)-dependent oxidoreductase [Streptomyces sp. MNU89]|uniref:SDR family NAD(P)-dependent oxidoreductase n=1 Tax=Streptomyces sp. MNU89 TaxID=2560025 RepID=UPI001E5712FD|nr:SDR family NAD(P)-dependent oxidoreductase [Streptomyces sp. MNU89]MCC9741428.1 SDR family NAD(P)-dependent oxidoreductase [Streptomyces sp. MNU89]